MSEESPSPGLKEKSQRDEELNHEEQTDPELHSVHAPCQQDLRRYSINNTTVVSETLQVTEQEHI